LKFTTQLKRKERNSEKIRLSDSLPVFFQEAKLELLPFPVKKWLHSVARSVNPNGE